MGNPILVHLETVLDRCTVCVERTIELEIILDAPEWNSNVTWVMWNLTSFRLETALALVQDSARLALDVPWAQKSFWTHLMYH